MSFQPETEVERHLYARLQERTKERDDAEDALARMRAVLEVYFIAYKETLAKRTEQMKQEETA